MLLSDVTSQFSFSITGSKWRKEADDTTGQPMVSGGEDSGLGDWGRGSRVWRQRSLDSTTDFKNSTECTLKHLRKDMFTRKVYYIL